MVLCSWLCSGRWPLSKAESLCRRTHPESMNADSFTRFLMLHRRRGCVTKLLRTIYCLGSLSTRNDTMMSLNVVLLSQTWRCWRTVMQLRSEPGAFLNCDLLTDLLIRPKRSELVRRTESQSCSCSRCLCSNKICITRRSSQCGCKLYPLPLLGSLTSSPG